MFQGYRLLQAISMNLKNIMVHRPNPVTDIIGRDTSLIIGQSGARFVCLLLANQSIYIFRTNDKISIKLIIALIEKEIINLGSPHALIYPKTILYKIWLVFLVSLIRVVLSNIDLNHNCFCMWLFFEDVCEVFVARVIYIWCELCMESERKRKVSIFLTVGYGGNLLKLGCHQ